MTVRSTASPRCNLGRCVEYLISKVLDNCCNLVPFPS